MFFGFLGLGWVEGGDFGGGTPILTRIKSPERKEWLVIARKREHGLLGPHKRGLPNAVVAEYPGVLGRHKPTCIAFPLSPFQSPSLCLSLSLCLPPYLLSLARSHLSKIVFLELCVCRFRNIASRPCQQTTVLLEQFVYRFPGLTDKTSPHTHAPRPASAMARSAARACRIACTHQKGPIRSDLLTRARSALRSNIPWIKHARWSPGCVCVCGCVGVCACSSNVRLNPLRKVHGSPCPPLAIPIPASSSGMRCSPPLTASKPHRLAKGRNSSWSTALAHLCMMGSFDEGGLPQNMIQMPDPLQDGTRPLKMNREIVDHGALATHVCMLSFSFTLKARCGNCKADRATWCPRCIEHQALMFQPLQSWLLDLNCWRHALHSAEDQEGAPLSMLRSMTTIDSKSSRNTFLVGAHSGACILQHSLCFSIHLCPQHHSKTRSRRRLIVKQI